MRTLEANPSCVEVPATAPAPFVGRAPHLPQKSDVGGFSALHFAQGLVSAAPHFAQKLLVEGLFVPHFEQRIDAPPSGPGNRPLLYHPVPGKGSGLRKDDRTSSDRLMEQ
jgi:hypothetical protein